MSITWQEVIVVALVAAAVAYLTRVTMQSLTGKKTGGCTTCSTCPTSESDKRLVQIHHASESDLNSTSEDQSRRKA